MKSLDEKTPDESDTSAAPETDVSIVEPNFQPPEVLLMKQSNTEFTKES